MKTTLALTTCLTALFHLGQAQEPCTKIGPCSCYNSKGVIDLTPLAVFNGTARFSDERDPTGQYFYSYNPCGAFSEGSCQHVAGCQKSADGTQQFPIGTQSTSSFINSATGLELRYSATADRVTRNMIINLVCEPIADGYLEVQGEQGANTYYFTLTSRHACFKSTPAYTTPPSLSKELDQDVIGLLGGILFVLCLLCVVLVGLSYLVYFVSRSSTSNDYHARVKVNGYGSNGTRENEAFSP